MMIRQHLYWPGIKNAVWKEVTNCDTCQRTNRSNIKYDELPDKEAEEIPQHKLYVDINGFYVIQKKVYKEYLNLKAITMIDPVTGWFEITQYNNKRATSITKLVESMCLSRYPRPMDITYDQGS